MKSFYINLDYEWFSDYHDGIHEITRLDYEQFYRGIGEGVTFNRQFEKLYMLKKKGVYMFLMLSPKRKLLILNGGAIKKAGNHTLEYFYDNLDSYATSIKMFLCQYDCFQEQVSREIKRIGGDGTIHGCIVDVDFYNHLYVNPLDGSIIPYHAYSMVEKYVYDNIPSLLKYKCPQLYKNYKRLSYDATTGNTVSIVKVHDKISKSWIFNDDTDMYRASRLIKGLQFTTKYNIVRLWNDTIAGESSVEKGRLIVSSIINPQER